MKLTAFQSDKGDCLLLESASGTHRMLVDGGVRRAYSEHVAPALGALRTRRKRIDIAYVSHIDQDHISGILQLLDDEAAWRVHEHQRANGNPGHTPPDSPRPPEVRAIFHNAFHDQIGKNSGEVESMLAAVAGTLMASDTRAAIEIGLAYQKLSTSVAEALRVSQRIKPGQLNIPLNAPAGGRLMMVRDDMAPIALGTISLHIIGPFAADVEALKKEWVTWLREHQEMVRKIRTQGKADGAGMGTSSVAALIAPMVTAAEALSRDEIALAKRLGLRAKVTTPNLASLMFLAEERGKTILLTGDGHRDDILKGLAHHGRLDAAGRIHVDTLKVQHHGSEHNIDKDFCDRVTADNYVFCGNGEHENPDLDVLRLIADRRMANDTRPFTFWFNSTSTLSVSEDGRAHMRQVEELVAALAKGSGGRLSTTFIAGSSMRVM
jgi:hypothetical protein